MPSTSKKIFAISYAAAQQLDKNQQMLAAKLDVLEQRDLAKIAELEEIIIRHAERISDLEQIIGTA